MHISLLKPGALAVLHSYQVKACLLDRDQPLAVFLAALPEWQTVYSDEVSVVLARKNAISEISTQVAGISNNEQTVHLR